MSKTKSTVTILHGPYGEAWAFTIKGLFGFPQFGWRRAKNEEKARTSATEEVGRWEKEGVQIIFDRVEVPVRAPKCGGNHKDDTGDFTTNGHAASEGIDIPFGGACPVQGTGDVDGYEAYYRARGEGWSLTITLSEDEEWTFGKSEYAFPDGGWLHRDESLANIATAVAAFRERGIARKATP